LDAFGKFHHLATSMELEVDLKIPCCSVIHGFFEAHERFSDLAREDKADMRQRRVRIAGIMCDIGSFEALPYSALCQVESGSKEVIACASFVVSGPKSFS